VARQYDLVYCERGCGNVLPPRAGSGRPRKYCTSGRKCLPPPPDGPVAVNLAALTNLDGLGLELRGRELWNAMQDDMPTAGHRTVLLEACRLADRAERMHALLCGERGAWAVLKVPDLLVRLGIDTGEIEITVNISSIAIEARNTAATLRSLMAELRAAVRQAGGTQREEGPDAVDRVADMLAERRARHGMS
jgi:hypothetical protein